MDVVFPFYTIHLKTVIWPTAVCKGWLWHPKICKKQLNYKLSTKTCHLPILTYSVQNLQVLIINSHVFNSALQKAMGGVAFSTGGGRGRRRLGVAPWTGRLEWQTGWYTFNAYTHWLHKKLDGVAPLVADPPRCNSTSRQNWSIHHLYRRNL